MAKKKNNNKKIALNITIQSPQYLYLNIVKTIQNLFECKIQRTKHIR